MYVPSQQETTLHCNVVSHWLGAYTQWYLQCSPIYHNTAYSTAITTEEYRDQTQYIPHISIFTGSCLLPWFLFNLPQQTWQETRGNCSIVRNVILQTRCRLPSGHCCSTTTSCFDYNIILYGFKLFISHVSCRVVSLTLGQLYDVNTNWNNQEKYGSNQLMPYHNKAQHTWEPCL